MRGQFARFPHRDIASGDFLSSSSRPTIVVAGDDGSDDVYFSNSNGRVVKPTARAFYGATQSLEG